MMPTTVPSMVAAALCLGLIIIRHFFSVCKKLTVYTDIYDIQLHFHIFTGPNNYWMADCSLDTLGLDAFLRGGGHFEQLTFPLMT